MVRDRPLRLLLHISKIMPSILGGRRRAVNGGGRKWKCVFLGRNYSFIVVILSRALRRALSVSDCFTLYLLKAYEHKFLARSRAIG